MHADRIAWINQWETARESGDLKMMEELKKDSVSDSLQLFDFSNAIAYRSALLMLQRRARPEVWSFESSSSHPEILDIYLKATFHNAFNEPGCIGYSYDGGHAAFNTGLLDRKMRGVYLLFDRNRGEERPRPWNLFAVTCPGDGTWRGNILTDSFKRLPQSPRPEARCMEQLYDLDSDFPAVSDDHIFIDRIHRFPYAVTSDLLPSDFRAMDVRTLRDDIHDGTVSYGGSARPSPKGDLDGSEITSLRQYLVSWLRYCKMNGTSAYRKLKIHFTEAVRRSLALARQDPLTAVPLRRGEKSRVSWALPVSFGDDPEKADMAVVISRPADGGGYRAVTALTLQMAYISARVLRPVHSAWLDPERLVGKGRPERPLPSDRGGRGGGCL
jgi:hypothetical protein